MQNLYIFTVDKIRLIMRNVLDPMGIDKVSLVKVLDFLPYPFLLSEFRDGVQQNIFVNKRFVEEIGYTCDDIPTIGEWFAVAYPDEDYRSEIMHDWAARLKAATHGVEDSVVKQARIQTRTNGLKWYEVKASVYNQYNFVAFVNIDEEITKEQSLQRLNENKDRTLSILSHDLRAPLSNLYSILQLVSNGLLTPAEMQTTLEKLTGQVFKMLEFLDTTLQWSNINFNKLQVSFRLIPAETIIRTILDIYKQSYAAKDITVHVQVNSGLPLFGDPEIFSILLRNIFSNAIKFTAVGGSIVVRNEIREGRYVLVVKNSGHGISAEKIAMIRSRNYESERGTIGEKGLGLGLRLCQQLLDNIGGSLEIESDHATTTVFKVIL